MQTPLPTVLSPIFCAIKIQAYDMWVRCCPSSSLQATLNIYKAMEPIASNPIYPSALILEWVVWSKYSSVMSQETMDCMLQSSQKKGPPMKSWGTLPCFVTILVYSDSKQSIKMFAQPGSAKFLLSPLSRILK